MLSPSCSPTPVFCVYQLKKPKDCRNLQDPGDKSAQSNLCQPIPGADARHWWGGLGGHQGRWLEVIAFWLTSSHPLKNISPGKVHAVSTEMCCEVQGKNTGNVTSAGKGVNKCLRK